MRARSVAFAAVVFAVATPAFADDPKAPTADDLKPTKYDFDHDSARKNGLDWHLATSAVFSLNDSENVIGQPDGATIILGLKVEEQTTLNHDKHEWRTSMLLGEGVSRSPVVPEFVKSRDQLTFDTIYLYHLTDAFGPFVRFGLDSPLFQNSDQRGGPSAYAITNLDGTVTNLVATNLHLTDTLRPVTLKETAGVFLRALSKTEVSVELRGGLAGMETFAKNQLAVTDDATTPNVIEVTQLDDVRQIGPDAVFEVWGDIAKKELTYRAYAEALIPFVHNDLKAGDDRTDPELTNIYLGAILSVHVFEFMSLDYELKAVREPQLLDEFQVRNNLFVSFGVNAGSPKKK